MLVVMPLITGGALHKILGKFGLRLPAGISRAMSSFGGDEGGRFGDRRRGLDELGGGGVQSLMKIAQMFI